jgi:hypothetical protein
MIVEVEPALRFCSFRGVVVVLSFLNRWRDKEALLRRAAARRGHDDSPLVVVSDNEAERVRVDEGDCGRVWDEGEVSSSGPTSEIKDRCRA